MSPLKQEGQFEEESYAEEHELEKLKQISNREHRSEDDNETIHRLVESLHQRNTAFRALELQYNHVKLQNESLIHQERKLRETVNTLEFEIAISEENVALLEEKVKNIACFEDELSARDKMIRDGDTNGPHSLDKLRGTLLNASHRQIYDLEQELRQLRRMYDNDSHQFTSKIVHLESQNQALREEAQALGEQLAQRTVLYSAQERRFQTHCRVSSMDIEGKNDELTRTYAKLQQLESQCAQLDRERIQLILKKNEHEEIIKTMKSAKEDDSERFKELEEELSNALEMNRSLQNTLSLLRGSDLEELERSMVINIIAAI